MSGRRDTEGGGEVREGEKDEEERIRPEDMRYEQRGEEKEELVEKRGTMIGTLGRRRERKRRVGDGKEMNEEKVNGSEERTARGKRAI